MGARRVSSWLAVVTVAALGLAGCEPYMSMTDRVPEQTRQASALLPESPRFVGMLDLETIMMQIDEVADVNFADSMRQTENPHLRAFLDATGMDPETDLKALYGSVGEGKSFAAVLFADLTPVQFDRYLEQAPGSGGEATTYRDVQVYHLTEGSGGLSADTLSLAFVQTGMIAVTLDAGRLRAMVDRHRDGSGSFRDNEPYMTLVQRVGHGSTAWLVGRNVLQSALRDSTAGEALEASSKAAGIDGSGLHKVLSTWSDRVLGLSEATESIEEQTDSRVGRLRRQVREQALSLTLADEAIDGEVYLTMEDEAGARNVVDIARGALAAVRLSKSADEIDEDVQALMDGIDIDRNGPIVHVEFSIPRERFRKEVPTAGLRGSTHRYQSSIRPADGAIRRMGGITPRPPALAQPRSC